MRSVTGPAGCAIFWTGMAAFMLHTPLGASRSSTTKIKLKLQFTRHAALLLVHLQFWVACWWFLPKSQALPLLRDGVLHPANLVLQVAASGHVTCRHLFEEEKMSPHGINA